MDIAASIQAVTEEVMLRLARWLAREHGLRNLCLAGGVALNCVANGKILREGISRTSGCSRRRAMPAARSVRRSRPGTSFSATTAHRWRAGHDGRLVSRAGLSHRLISSNVSRGRGAFHRGCPTRT